MSDRDDYHDDEIILNAYQDGELSPGETLAIEGRLAADPDLRTKVHRLAALSNAVREALSCPPAPDALRRRIFDKLALRETQPQTRRWQRLAAGVVLGVAVGAAGGTAITSFLLAQPGAAGLDTLLTAHLRALAAPQPFDVASSDRHTVKPWFNGKTSVAPEVPDLSDAGFQLIGGRIDIVERQPVPTIVYRHCRHIVDLTILPRGTARSAGKTIAGYRIERWVAEDLAYTAIADIPAADLEAFAGAYRSRAAPPRR